MMVAMMLPSAAPMILLHARIDRARSARRRLLHTMLFASAYLLVWAAFSAVAAIAQAALFATGLLSAANLTLGSRWLAAAMLATAAVYQLGSAKAACLDQCRSPIHFVMRFWKPGAAGAVRLGVVHGLYCLGCCWALMLLLFVGGVMNLAWVAALALMVFVEKLAPAQWHASRWIAAALAACAIAIVMI
jgi:predicted metal-binding membrane protein